MEERPRGSTSTAPGELPSPPARLPRAGPLGFALSLVPVLAIVIGTLLKPG